MLHELFKNKGSPAIDKNYRDVSIASHMPKVVTKHIRRVLMPDLDQHILSAQWGSGHNGGETAIAHLYARNMIHIAQRDKLSLSMIFTDITTVPVRPRWAVTKLMRKMTKRSDAY